METSYLGRDKVERKQSKKKIFPKEEKRAKAKKREKRSVSIFPFLIFYSSKEYELMFKIIDRDNDGFLSVLELQKCCKALRRSEEDMHDILQNLDKDGDGKISLKEWLALVQDDN